MDQICTCALGTFVYNDEFGEGAKIHVGVRRETNILKVALQLMRTHRYSITLGFGIRPYRKINNGSKINCQVKIYHHIKYTELCASLWPIQQSIEVPHYQENQRL